MLVLVVAIGVALRIVPWLRDNTFFGQQEYDDAVYYASAKLLLHGQVPYRDFIILHPPGVPLFLLPWAAVGAAFGDSVGLASARLAMLAVAAANMGLIYAAIVSGARGYADAAARRGALLGVALYAVAPTAVDSEHTVMLEPLVTLFCLSAAVLLLKDGAGKGSALTAGIFLVAGLNIKVFGAAYLIVIALTVVARHRLLLRYFAAGLAVAGAGDVLMVVLAPRAFVHDVVITQLRRPSDTTARGAARVATAFGLGGTPSAVALVLLIVLLGMAALLVLRERASLLSFWLSLTVLIAVALTTSRSFFPHYGAFLAAPFAVTMGLASTATPPLMSRKFRVALVAGAVLTLGLFAVGSVAESATHTNQPDLSSITDEVPRGSCIFYETVSEAVAINRLEVPSRDCPAWIDGRGVLYSQSTEWPSGRPFYQDGFTTNTTWQAGLRDQMAHANYLVLSGDPLGIREWSPTTKSYVVSNFRKVTDVSADGAGRLQLWRR